MLNPESSEQPGENGYSFFDNRVETDKIHSSYLPHWQQKGVIFFVTFRLADSLPQEKLQALIREKATWIRENPEPNTAAAEERSRQNSRKVQQWLDAGYGSMILAREDAKDVVEKTLRHFEDLRYILDEWVVAANHVHVLVAPKQGFELLKILQSWKSFSSKELLKLSGMREKFGTSTVWQRESWDHIVRSEASLEKFRRYIRNHKIDLG